MDVQQGCNCQSRAVRTHLRGEPGAVNKPHLAFSILRTIGELLIVIALLALMYELLDANLARADERRSGFVTEFGGGYKLPYTTSYVLLPQCDTIYSFLPRERDPAKFIRSCGGDNPVFTGWPIAYDFELRRGHVVRFGWFHLSHWFDGGKDRETHLDCFPCVTYTHRWNANKW